MHRYFLTLVALLTMVFGIYSIIKGFEDGIISNFFSEASNDSFSVDESPIMFWIMMAVTAFCTSVSPYAVYILWRRNKPNPKEKQWK